MMSLATGERRGCPPQRSRWVASTELGRSKDHGLYQRRNRVLNDARLGTFRKEKCAKFYVDGIVRPSLTPARYFRMLLVRFEARDSGWAIA